MKKEEELMTVEIYRCLGQLFFQFLGINEKKSLGFQLNLTTMNRVLRQLIDDIEQKKGFIAHHLPELSLNNCYNLQQMKQLEPHVEAVEDYINKISRKEFTKVRNSPDIFYCLYKTFQMFYKEENPVNQVFLDLASQLEDWNRSYIQSIVSDVVRLSKEKNYEEIKGICKRVEIVKMLISFFRNHSDRLLDTQETKRLLNYGRGYQIALTE